MIIKKGDRLEWRAEAEGCAVGIRASREIHGAQFSAVIREVAAFDSYALTIRVFDAKSDVSFVYELPTYEECMSTAETALTRAAGILMAPYTIVEE